MNEKWKILVIDDENKSRLWLTEILERVVPEADIQSSNNPVIALEMINSENYDLLFLDYDMPQMNGIEVIHKIEEMASPPSIVLISAFKEFDFAKKGIEIGALDYLIKPFYDDEIVRILEAFKRKNATTEDTNQDFIILSTIQGDCLIKKDSIALIEVEGRNALKVYNTDNNLLHVKSSLQKVHARLPENFIYITRQCIVNRNMIRWINPKACEIVLFNGNNEETYSCSRKQMKAFVKWRNSCK